MINYQSLSLIFPPCPSPSHAFAGGGRGSEYSNREMRRGPHSSAVSDSIPHPAEDGPNQCPTHHRDEGSVYREPVETVCGHRLHCRCDDGTKRQLPATTPGTTAP